MTVLEASKSTNARADGFAALRAGKTASSSTSPMSQSARTRTSRPSEISFLAAAPTVIEMSPSPATAATPRRVGQQAGLDGSRLGQCFR